MITVGEVVSYIKRSLGEPFVSLELMNSQIEEIVMEDALKDFTKYVPDTNRIILEKKISNRVNPKMENLYWIRDPEERRVYSVIEVNQSNDASIASNYPITMPITSYDGLPEKVLQIHKSVYSMHFTSSDLTWRQEGTKNQVWIFSDDSLSGYYSVKYTRSHAPDLHSIPEEYVMDFQNLSLARVQIVLGSIRTKYGTLNTPLGDIQINAEIGNQGKELLNATIEELKKIQPPHVPLYIG